MKKRCLSCGWSFSLSGSGRRQKYCRTCAAKSASEFTNPIDLMKGRWRGRIGKKLRHTIVDLELAPPLKGLPVNLLFEDEVPLIGCGYRAVLCQFRGKRVVLHHAGYTATIKREVFKDLVRANKRRRKRNRNIIEFPARETIELDFAA